VRRLILMAMALGLAGLVLYRQRTINRWEQELGIGQPSRAPS
jgi:hypothetical protein